MKALILESPKTSATIGPKVLKIATQNDNPTPLCTSEDRVPTQTEEEIRHQIVVALSSEAKQLINLRPLLAIQKFPAVDDPFMSGDIFDPALKASQHLPWFPNAHDMDSLSVHIERLARHLTIQHLEFGKLGAIIRRIEKTHSSIRLSDLADKLAQRIAAIPLSPLKKLHEVSALSRLA